ncbi:(2Fe-2S)-binding protein [Skermania piniformis]|uniref:(2Fe-2S)-binding protein n=1 Tax=Skermania pinensis TaxID=39122 RepID=A0ABX8SE12_9ACTN|nr:(2Fe-2S)-binding protein [Skermania piniformis]QXQ15402.1 (2Fe-2S)-binding protein [Skermania piniformis]
MVEQPAVGGTAVGGTALADPAWLAARLIDLAAAWQIDDLRVAGTLWWYMASATLLDAPVHDSRVDPGLTALVVELRPDGSVARVRHTGSARRQIPALREMVRCIVVPLAEVSGAAERSLWAVTTDAIAGHCLAAPARADELTAAIPELPSPRFVDVGERRFVRRGSCCLIYRSPIAGLCTSCPKRPPAERDRLLAALVGDRPG